MVTITSCMCFCDHNCLTPTRGTPSRDCTGVYAAENKATSFQFLRRANRQQQRAPCPRIPLPQQMVMPRYLQLRPFVRPSAQSPLNGSDVRISSPYKQFCSVFGFGRGADTTADHAPLQLVQPSCTLTCKRPSGCVRVEMR